MIKKITVFIICWFVVTSNTTFAQGTDFNFLGAGARAAGMGNAFIGVADDATAISWNPAGLSQLIKPEVSLLGRYSTYDYKLESSAGNIEGSSSLFGVNFASFAYPFRSKFNPVAAVAYQTKVETILEYESDQIKEKYDIKLNTVSLGLGMRFDFFSIGLAANSWFSGGDGYTSVVPVFSDGASLFYDVNQTIESSFSGFSIVGGILLDFNYLENKLPFKIGFKYSPSFELKNEMTLNIEGYDEFNQFTEVNANSDQTYEMPSVLGFGASVRVLDNLTLAADYEILQSEDKKITNGAFLSSGTEITQETVDNLSASNENMNQYRLGFEYLIFADDFVMPVRAGFRSHPTLAADVDENGTIGDQATGNSFSFGLGVVLDQLSFDVAYEYLSYDVKNSQTDLTNTITTSFITLSGILYFK